MYFQFIALLHTEVDIIPHGKQRIIYIMVSKTWLLMIWWNMNPDLQQPLCWLVLPKCENWARLCFKIDNILTDFEELAQFCNA